MRFRIDLKILIYMSILYFTQQLELYFLTMFFCFLHEIGHLTMGLLLGLKPSVLEIMPLGFSIKFYENNEKNKKEKIKSNIFIALAGPIVNLIIIFFLQCIPITQKDILIYINLIILCFNLLPIYPLDGGRILQNFLFKYYDNITTYKYMNKISINILIILTMIFSVAVYYLKNIAVLLIIIYLWVMVLKENKEYNIYNKIYLVN